MNVDRRTADRLLTECDEALQAVAERNGFVLSRPKGTYGDVFTYKVEFARMGEDGVVDSTEARAFRMLATAYDMQPEDLGKTFVNRGEFYTITGLNSRAHKMPILAKRLSDGKTFKFNEVTVKVGLGVAERLGR